MTVNLDVLLKRCEGDLQPSRFSDYCPNGLQVEGVGQVARLATAVTANQSVIDAAITWQADALLVHHGYFWRGESPVVVGMKRQRLQSLLAAGISLIAYHLPLDAHPVFGNNRQWGLRLGIDQQRPILAGDFGPSTPGALVVQGALPAPVELATLAAMIAKLTQREPVVIEAGAASVQHIAWCTGGAQSYIEQAADAGVDVYISGEISEPTVHTARERGVAYIAAGHHATERYGVQAYGESLAQRYELDWTFIDCDNPA